MIHHNLWILLPMLIKQMTNEWSKRNALLMFINKMNDIHVLFVCLLFARCSKYPISNIMLYYTARKTMYACVCVHNMFKLDFQSNGKFLCLTNKKSNRVSQSNQLYQQYLEIDTHTHWVGWIKLIKNLVNTRRKPMWFFLYFECLTRIIVYT